MSATRADKMRAFARHEEGEEYEWSAEGIAGPEGNDEYDCSGFFWAGMRAAGVKLTRTTAHGYYRMGRRIAKPTRVGDFFVLLNGAGHAHHIGYFIGMGQSAEARGEAYGVRIYTVAQVNARGAVWLRLPDVDMGSLSITKPPTTSTPPAVPRYPGYPLKRGTRGSAVRTFQKRMIARGWRLEDGADGIYGEDTQRMVRLFQKEKHLRVTGIVDYKTWVAAWTAPITR